MIPSNAVKTAIDRAAEAIEAAENMFADEMGVTLDLSSAAKLALIATITASIRAAVAEERQRLVWADRVRWSESGPRITLARGTARLPGQLQRAAAHQRARQFHCDGKRYDEPRRSLPARHPV